VGACPKPFVVADVVEVYCVLVFFLPMHVVCDVVPLEGVCSLDGLDHRGDEGGEEPHGDDFGPEVAEEGHEEPADMFPIRVGVGETDHLLVAQLFEVFVVASDLQTYDFAQVGHFLVVEDGALGGFHDVEDLPPEGVDAVFLPPEDAYAVDRAHFG